MSDRPANGSGYSEPAPVDIDAATRRLMAALDALESAVERRRDAGPLALVEQGLDRRGGQLDADYVQTCIPQP